MSQLFETFEINRKRRWPRVARWLIFSFAVHFVFVAAILYGPTLHALWQLAHLAAGAEYADEEYSLGKIKERAVMINASDKLYDLPPDYFKNQEPAPEIVATPEPTPMPTPSPTPPNPQELEQQRTAVEMLAQTTGVPLPPRINARPFKDMLKKWAGEWEKGRLDLNGNIEVTVEADRLPDGTLTNMEMTGASGDNPVLKDLANDVALTLSASHALAFLEGATRVKMILTLNQQKLSVQASSALDSESRASKMASVYGLGIGFERMRRSGTDEGEVWNNTSVTSRGKEVIINFEMSRATAGSLLAKQVEKVKSEP